MEMYLEMEIGTYQPPTTMTPASMLLKFRRYADGYGDVSGDGDRPLPPPTPTTPHPSLYHLLLTIHLQHT